MKKMVTVYDSSTSRTARFSNCLDKTGKKVILEQAENCLPPFVKVRLVSMEFKKVGGAGNAGEWR